MSVPPVRVLLVTPQFPPEIGGVSSYVGWLARMLAEDPAFDVTVVSVASGRRRTRESVDGVEVIRLPAWMRVSNTPVNPWWLAQLRSLFRELRPDVVNAHSPVPFLADVAVAAAGPVPVVLTYHAGSLLKGTGGPVDLLLRTYERHVLPRVFRSSDALVAVSPVSRAHATGRAVMIPPGVDGALFHPPAAGTSREPRIVYVGRIERSSAWKGLSVLLDALPEVLARVPEAVLELVGEGDLVPALMARAESLGVSDRLRWRGAMNPPQVAELMREAGVVVLPSLTESESFGMVLIEAMASGTAVVGSRVGGIPGVVRDGVDGLLVDPGDPHELAVAVAEVLEQPDLAGRLGRHGRSAVEGRWDWKWQAEATRELLTHTAGRRGEHVTTTVRGR